MKLAKFLAIATCATAIGWFVGGLAILVTLGHLLDEEWDDEHGGFDPDQVLQRLRDTSVNGAFVALLP